MSRLNRVAAAVSSVLLWICTAMAAAYESPDMLSPGSVRMYDRELKYAVDLYGRGLYIQAEAVLSEIPDEHKSVRSEGYRVLCAIRLERTGYRTDLEDYITAYPYSGLIPQMRFHYALNLFDDGDYRGASEQLEQLSRRQIYRSQVTEFLFRKAYCDLENGIYGRSLKRFAEVLSRPLSDYTAPSQYFSGYILYQQERFGEAYDFFSRSVKDPRFADISGYYMLECRFMDKDYDYVVQKGPQMMESVPEERRVHLARLISESYLVLGDADKARKYFYRDAVPEDEKTRTDYFYAGSVLFAVKDWAGATENFSMMPDRTDSLGQIASYQMAYAYIQLKNKVAAMEAFREAAVLPYNPEMAEDAYYNYAKLAFDLNNDISAFDGYLTKYSDLKRGDRVYSYIAVGALRNRDYASAVEAYDKVEVLDPVMKTNYMKANYLRANELVSDGSWRAAVPCLRAAAYYSDRREMFNQLSRFWLAEAYYRDGQYDKSMTVLKELYNTSALYGMDESPLIPYSMGYCYFQQGMYPEAAKWFGEYVGTGSEAFRKEALLRRGDCFFLQRDYRTALEVYRQVLDGYFDKDDIYPYYYAAMSCGLTGDIKGKVKLLSPVQQADPSSPYYPEAMLELGRAYAADGNDQNAEKCFGNMLTTVKDSTYMSKALVELGTLARNRDDMDAALAYYRQVVEQMPLSESTSDALAAIETIYQSRNDPESYLAYIDSMGMSSLKTEQEKEDMIYNAAEQIFLSGNYEKALASLQSYLSRYPLGAKVNEAEFYLGETLMSLGRKEQACDRYSVVMEHGSGSFREIAALRYSVLSYGLQRYADAFKGYSFLKDIALMPENADAAQVGMMRSAYAGKMYMEAVANAGPFIREGVGQDLRAEAEYITAKSYMAMSRRDEALPFLEKLSSAVSTEYGAEAAYLLIQDSYDRGDFAKVEEKVYAFSESDSPVQYWLAKSFVVLGDAFAESGDYEQAKATFESVRDGYNPDKPDDVKDNLDLRISKLEKLIESQSAGAQESQL